MKVQNIVEPRRDVQTLFFANFFQDFFGHPVF